MPMTKRRYPALLVLLASLSAMTGCQDTPRALQQARDTLARTLPAPYFEDLVTESVSVEGDRLVPLSDSVALVEGHLTDANRALATAYLEQLYSPEAQAMALRHYYRAWDTSAADPADVARFPEVERLSIADFGGWAVVQPEHFGDGGIFDQIYQAQ